MPTVSHLEALEILDCRGVPTLEVSCVLDGGIRGNAAAPAAGTPGPAEVRDLRDGEELRHRGLGCRKAAAFIEGEIRAALVGKKFSDQAAFDRALRLLDGTQDRSRLGGNTSFAVSLAFARAHAAGRSVPLYRHFAELVGGPGKGPLPLPIFALFSHTPGDAGDRGPLALAMIPSVAADVDAALAFAASFRRRAETLSREKFDGRVGSAPDGGIEAPFYDTASMLNHADTVLRGFGSDRPAVEWVLRGSGQRREDAGWYRIDREKLTAKEVIERFTTWAKRWPLAAVIDPLGAEDWPAWSELCGKLPPGTFAAADDLVAGHLVRMEKAATEKAARALVIKPSQTGSLTDAARTVRFARKAGFAIIASGRTGETEDDWLTDLAVGWGAEYLQAGPLAGSERLAKYNRLLAIEKKTKWPLYRRPPGSRTT